MHIRALQSINQSPSPSLSLFTHWSHWSSASKCQFSNTNIDILQSQYFSPLSITKHRGQFLLSRDKKFIDIYLFLFEKIIIFYLLVLGHKIIFILSFENLTQIIFHHIWKSNQLSCPSMILSVCMISLNDVLWHPWSRNKVKKNPSFHYLCHWIQTWTAGLHKMQLLRRHSL